MSPRILAVALLAGAALLPARAQAQSAIQAAIPDTIAFMMGQMGSGWPEPCLALKWQEKPKSAARFAADAEPGLRDYLALAARGQDLTPVYKREFPDRWQLDGATTQDLLAVRDPWAAKVSRLEPVGIMLGRGEVNGHGVWRAYDGEGALLGTYDALMIRKAKGYAIGWVRLWSPGQEAKIASLTPFCGDPGDHEAYVEAKAKAEAEKAKRKAERAAAAAEQQ